MSGVPDSDNASPARRAARTLLRIQHLRGRRPPPVGDEVRSYRALIAYDGTDYAGWQRQPELVSLCEMVEAAFEAATGCEAVVHAAGRTDAGVHADGQAIRLHSRTGLPPDALRHLALQLLPPEIRVNVVEPAPPDWHPQRNAVRKLYRYTILEQPAASPVHERTAWRIWPSLSVDALRAGAGHLIGECDFRAFRNDPGPARRDQNTVRSVERIDVERALGRVRIDVQGPGFLYMMVRNIAAALVEVGAGRRPPEWIAEILASRNRRLAPPPAPPGGLTLVRIEYRDGFGASNPPPGGRGFVHSD